MYDSSGPHGTIENFDTQPRTYDAVVEHMRALGLPPKQIRSLGEFERLHEHHVKYTSKEVSVLVLGLFVTPNSDNLHAFEEATFGRLAPVFVWTDNRDILVSKGYITAEHTGDAIVVVTLFNEDAKVP